MAPKTFAINRRRLLKTTAAITAATGVPGWFLELERANAAQSRALGPNAREASQWLSREQRKPYDYSFIA